MLDRLLGRGPAKQVVFERDWVVVLETPRDGWQWMEDHRLGDGFVCDELKFRTAGGAGQLVLSVKDYAVSSPGNDTLEDLCRRDWRAYYAPTLPNIDSLAVANPNQRMMRGGDVSACEVVVDGRLRPTEPPGGLRLRERYAPVGRHMFIVSATGARGLFDQHAAIVDSWFDSASFIARP